LRRQAIAWDRILAARLPIQGWRGRQPLMGGRCAVLVLDARATGTGPGEPWRILLLPQPERILLMVRIDTFGVHQIGLYKSDEALRLLSAWLPRGPRADSDLSVDADGVLASSERSALVTVTHYTAQGSAEIAGASTDLVLARQDGRVHVFSRDPLNRAKLVSSRRDGKDIDDMLADLLT
jgi:hypothetical protein